LCVGFGIFKGKIDHAEKENRKQAEQFANYVLKDELVTVTKCTDEDRVHNSEHHRQLFESVNAQTKEIGELNAMRKSMKESLDELKNDIRIGLK
jgi:hypothetical protein